MAWCCEKGKKHLVRAFVTGRIPTAVVSLTLKLSGCCTFLNLSVLFLSGREYH